MIPNEILAIIESDRSRTCTNLEEQLRGKAVSKKDLDLILERATEAIAGGKIDEATKYLFAGLSLSGGNFKDRIQRKGCLRSSRFSYDTDVLQHIVQRLCACNEHFDRGTVDYLASVCRLYDVAKCVRTEYLLIKEWLNTNREEGVKAAIVMLDLIFSKHFAGLRFEDKQSHRSTNPDFFSTEELAGGLSTVLSIYGNEIGSLKSNSQINNFRLLDDALSQILISGANIAEFRSWEIEIDRHGYSLQEIVPGKKYELKPPSMEYLRSVELGYIETNVQRRVRGQEQMERGGKSLLQLATQVSQAMDKAGLIPLVDDPIPRYRFNIPGKILAELTSLEPLEDEIINFNLAAQDLLTPADDLMEREIGPDLTFRDLFMFARFAKIWWGIIAAKLMPKFQGNYEVVIQSLLPTLSNDLLQQMVSAVLGEKKANTLINMFTLDIQDHVDIQYRPIVPLSEFVWVPTAVLAGANYYRNQLQNIRKRLYEDGTEDPLTLLLEKTFRDRGYFPVSGITYVGGEVDLLVLVDGILFAFECKNSLLPTDSHELMTSWDYIEKAKSQLDRFLNQMRDPVFRELIAKKLGTALPGNLRIATGIVMANRMFAGYRNGQHPVRGAYDLVGFIEEGEVCLGGQSRSLWKSDCFSGEDLVAYLLEDSTYLPKWKAMQSYFARYKIGDVEVRTPRFLLDQVNAASAFGFENAKELFETQAESLRQIVSKNSLAHFYSTAGEFPGRDVQSKTAIDQNLPNV
jgi:hypothetical protein